MQELTIKTKILLDKLKGHKKIKKDILKLIDDMPTMHSIFTIMLETGKDHG